MFQSNYRAGASHSTSELLNKTKHLPVKKKIIIQLKTKQKEQQSNLQQRLYVINNE
jgi:hypothetical protein